MWSSIKYVLGFSMLFFVTNIWSQQTFIYQAYPFLYFSADDHPVIKDWDNDGDNDIISFVNQYTYWDENIGTASVMNFANGQIDLAIPIPNGADSIGSSVKAELIDLDFDGDLDILGGTSAPFFYYMENIGTAENPLFDSWVPNPFGLLGNPNGATLPKVVDIDNDLDYDVFFCTYTPGATSNIPLFTFYRNVGTPTSPEFVYEGIDLWGLVPPVSGMFITNSFDIADIDGDCDLDIICVNPQALYDSKTLVYVNSGTQELPIFSTPLVNPYALSWTLQEFGIVTLGDMDADGDQDLFNFDVFYSNHYYKRSGFDTIPNIAPDGADLTICVQSGYAYTFNYNQFYFSDADNCQKISGIKVVDLPSFASDFSLNGSAVVQNQIIRTGGINNLVYSASPSIMNSIVDSIGFQVFDGNGFSDSTYFIYLLITPNTIQNVSICNGESYVSNNTTHTTPGQYTDTLSSIAGCDSIVTLNLTVFPTYNTILEQAICQGGAVSIGNNSYTESGNYIDTLSTLQGCDSIVSLSLNILNAYQINQSVQICAYDSYTVGTDTYTSSGIYTNTFTANSGCDSVIITNLSVVAPTNDTISYTNCAGEALTIGNQTYTQSVVFLDTIPSQIGCDSAYLLYNILFYPPTSSQLNYSICQNETVTVGSVIYNNAGTYNDTLNNVYGCDSVVTVQITQYDTSFYEQEYTLCEGDTLWIDNQIFTKTGIYPVVFTNALGCDSTVVYRIRNANNNYCDSLHAPILIPNVFTPNDDNINDLFVVFPGNGVTLIKISIFDRWGNFVFESSAQQPFWDGTFRGALQSSEIFVYVIELIGTNGQHFVKSGDVLLLR